MSNLNAQDNVAQLPAAEPTAEQFAKLRASFVALRADYAALSAWADTELAAQTKLLAAKDQALYDLQRRNKFLESQVAKAVKPTASGISRPAPSSAQLPADDDIPF